MDKEKFNSTNTSYQKDAIRNAVQTILNKVNGKKSKKSVELTVKNDIRKVTGSPCWYRYHYEDHIKVLNMLRDGYHFYISFSNKTSEIQKEGGVKISATDDILEDLPSYEEARLLNPNWMMPKQFAYSLGISVQQCSYKINKLNIKSNERLALPYLADLKIGARLCWLYNPVIIKMMDD